MPLEQASLLQAVVAFGVIFGAGMAGHYVALQNAYKVLPLGLWLGLSLPALAFSTSLWIAIPLMLITGFAGGMLMVPMNAVLQNRGYILLTAGRSLPFKASMKMPASWSCWAYTAACWRWNCRFNGSWSSWALS